MSSPEPQPKIFGDEFREKFFDDRAILTMADEVEALAQRYLEEYGADTIEDLPEEAFTRMDEELATMRWPREDNRE